MTTRRIMAIAGVVAIGLFVFMIGCSNDNQQIVTKWDGSIEPENTISSFFPLTENYATTYSIKQSSGATEEVTFQIGEIIQFGSSDAYQWISIDEAQEVDTSYLVVTSDALIYYRTANVGGETILALPLIPGKSWERNSDVITGSYDITNVDINDETFNPAEDIFGGYWGGYAKEFPVSGDATMTVKTIESLQLSSGISYPSSYLISNKVSSDKYNYYWYVPEVGLAKYVIGGSYVDHENGNVVGELIEYGIPSN